MEQEYRHAIALMRYSAIAPLIPGLPKGIRASIDRCIRLKSFRTSLKRSRLCLLR